MPPTYGMEYRESGSYSTESALLKYSVKRELGSLTPTFTATILNLGDARRSHYSQFERVKFYYNSTVILEARIERIDPMKDVHGRIEKLKISGRGHIAELMDKPVVYSTLDAEYTSDTISETTLGDTGQSWTIDEWAGYGIIITDGDGESNMYRIASNSATVLTLLDADGGAPTILTDGVSSGDKFQIGKPGHKIVRELVDLYGSYVNRSSSVDAPASWTIWAKTWKLKTSYHIIAEVGAKDGHDFWVGSGGVLYYKERGVLDSGETINEDTDPIKGIRWIEPGEELFNQVDVYGGTVGGTQIAERADNRDSQEDYDVTRRHVHVDTNILTRADALNYAEGILNEKSEVERRVKIITMGYDGVDEGDKIKLIIPSQSMDTLDTNRADDMFVIYGVEYLFPSLDTVFTLGKDFPGLALILSQNILASKWNTSRDIDEATITAFIEKQYVDFKFKVKSLTITTTTKTGTLLPGVEDDGRIGVEGNPIGVTSGFSSDTPVDITY